MDRRACLDMHKPIIGGKACRRRGYQSGAGHLRKPRKVDVDVLCVPDAFDISGKHSRIGRLHVGADQRRAKSGYGLHGKRLEQGDLRMTTADKYKFASCGYDSAHQDG